MKVYVTGSSALWYWRHDAQCLSTLEHPATDLFADCPAKSAELEAIDLNAEQFGHGPIRLMVANTKQRVLKHRYSYSVRTVELPERSYYEAGESTCVASPELCLVQAAGVYTFAQLMELCMEFTGKYALDHEAPRGFTQRATPLTTIERVRGYIGCLAKERGTAKLREALAYIEEGSRSPMETREYLLAFLPKHLGSYGIPKPEVNARINLNSREQEIARRAYLECDLFWPEHRVAIEYDGDPDHASFDARSRDAKKRNALLTHGICCFTITAREILDADAFDSVMREVADELGFRLQGFPKDWKERRDKLRTELFKSMSYTGARHGQ